MYEANRIDEGVQFTPDACEQLTGIPKAFLRQALEGIVSVKPSNGALRLSTWNSCRR